MSLSAPAARRHLHTRSIVCEGFRRDDGLWDIEAQIVDTKTYGYEEPDRGLRNPGDPVHHMAVRLTLDDRMVVQGVEVSMPATPYTTCLTAAPAYQGLIGRQVGLGWRRAVNECVGGTRGCTHVRELLFPMATVAFQTMGGWKEKETGTENLDDVPANASGRPYFLDGCKSWAVDGPVVARLHPQFAVRRAPAAEER
ncbi:DUF2889 domain-containing protein [Quisquiliibacterium transsilvanicum]|uniref:DUF2889 domain-containing protein n=1 Tax=Quisquiliibacterium transsilvanicum TaxID=1549638 RepID=A0A7W8HH52_9BURK|nr:DUF2889 domain-containing protein [Quisquiliibacterium transsilvanicum]MBB5271974.1 hypothetical protein [Quisquiliibacterium transsilvanicum]